MLTVLWHAPAIVKCQNLGKRSLTGQRMSSFLKLFTTHIWRTLRRRHLVKLKVR